MKQKLITLKTGSMDISISSRLDQFTLIHVQ